MAAFDYSRARATATRLLKRFGQAATLRQVTGTGGDPWEPTTTTTDVTVTVAVLDYRAEEVDGTVIKRSDRRVYMAADGSTAPATDDALVIAGKTFRLVSVEPLTPAGTAVYFELQARG